MLSYAWPGYCRALLASSVASAAARFPGRDEDAPERVHGVRKTLKESRALARLFLPSVGEPARVAAVHGGHEQLPLLGLGILGQEGRQIGPVPLEHGVELDQGVDLGGPQLLLDEGGGDVDAVEHVAHVVEHIGGMGPAS